MKKIMKATSFVLCFLLMFMLLGCWPWKNIHVTEDEPQIEEQEFESPEKPAKTLSDDPYSYSFILDGTIYTLPAPFSEFAKDGWEIQNGTGYAREHDTLDPGEELIVFEAKHGDHVVDMYLINNDVDVQKLDDCDVSGISFDKYDSKKGAELIFPGRITIGTPEEDVLSLYGEPSYRNDGSAGNNLTYNIEPSSYIGIDVDVDSRLVNRLYMRHPLRSDNSNQEGSTIATGDAPDVVKAYRQPNALGGSWDSFTLKYDNVLYQMPIPVTELVANGWVCVSDENMMIDAKDYKIGFDIRHGNQVLHTNLDNYADTQQPAKYCFVTKIEYYREGTNVSFELPGGLSEKSSIEDFIKTYGEPREMDEYSSLVFYTWGDVYKSLSIAVEKDTKQIHRLELEYRPRSL